MLYKGKANRKGERYTKPDGIVAGLLSEGDSRKN